MKPSEPSSSSSSFPSPLPSSSSSKDWIYDVFLSFRGVDTRHNFTDHLYAALDCAGIRAFRDAEGLRRGVNIEEELVGIIQGCRISLIVFSKNYADSSWCLDELVQIMECRKTLRQLVFPIFYHVQPSDVRFPEDRITSRKDDIWSDTFWKKHQQKQKRRAALREAANLAGWHLSPNQSEVTAIRSIVNQIIRGLNTASLTVAKNPVGIDHYVDKIGKCLGVGYNDVRMVGIWGMGGIGKTEVAKAIYNKFMIDFDSRSFLEDVRETAKDPKGKIILQEKLLYEVLKPTKLEVVSVCRGINMIKERLGSKKVLLIVDNVDDQEQLDALACECDSFGQGSRIIITTRDRHLLRKLPEDTIHEIQKMSERSALELFNWHAFQNHGPLYEDSHLVACSRKVVDYCGGLPLALAVVGASLFGRKKVDWDDTLKTLEKIPPSKIQSKLKISYDAMDENQREIFLHISCFLIGMDKDHAKHILEGCDLSAELDVLVDRCLLTVSEKNKLMMHDLLRDMGREIVREEFPKFPGKRSRLWRNEEIIEVLTDDYGTEGTEGLALKLQRSNNIKPFSTESFRKMRLKLLQLDYVQLTGDCDKFAKKLRWLRLRGFSQQIICNEFLNERNLVSIDLRNSKLVRVWEYSGLLEKLKRLDLSHSHDLRELPDLSNLPNLEYLKLKDCKNLSEIPESVGQLERLALVNLKDCIMLKDLPKSFYELKSVKTLVLSGCSSFAKLDEDIGKMISLRTLLVSGTTEIPFSVQSLKRRLDYSSRQSLKRQNAGRPSHD